MTTAYSNLLGLALPVTGELSGTWGDTVNDYITKYLDDAIANAQIISGSQTAVTLSKTTGASLVSAGSGATGSAQYALIRCTGNPASTLTITVDYSSLTNAQFSKTYLIFNSTSTSQSVVVRATTSSGTSTGVTITSGEKALIAWNGTDFVKIATQSGTGEFVTVDTTNLEVTNIKAKDGTAAATIADSTGAITVSTILNVDNLRLDTNTISSTDTNGNIVLAPNGNGDVQLDADTVRVGDSNVNVTITSNGTADLILNTNAGTNSGSITIEDGVNGNIIIAPNGTGQVQISNAALDLTTIEVTNIKAKDGTASMTLADSTGVVTFSKATVIEATDNTNAALRITQLGTGNALLVEDSANPDTTPFVVTATGDVGIGTSSPTGYLANKLVIATGTDSNNGITIASATNRNGAIWFADGTTGSEAYRGGVDYQHTTDTLYLYSGGQGNFQLTAAGNIGLGVTPSAWFSTSRVYQFGSGGALEGRTNESQYLALTANQYIDSAGARKYIGSTFASLYQQYNGKHEWFTAPSGFGYGTAATSLTATQNGNSYTIVTAGTTDFTLIGAADNNVGTTFTKSGGTGAGTGTVSQNISFTQAMTLLANGNLGVGETNPSTILNLKQSTGPIVRLVRTSNRFELSADNDFMSLNARDASTYINFKTEDTERGRFSSDGTFRVKGAGTAGSTDAVQFSGSAPASSLILDSSGNLGIGTTTTTSAFLNIANEGPRNEIMFRGTPYTNIFSETTNGFQLGIASTGSSAAMEFLTNNAERARITSGGYFKAASLNASYINSSGSYHEFNVNVADDTVRIRNESTSTPYGIDINFSGAAPDNNTQYFLQARDNASGGTTRCIIYSDGDLANHDGVYGTISDQKLKQDIVDAGSQWADIKAIRFRKYRMKSDVAANPDAPALLGVIAQELEQVSPGLVDEHPDMETVEVTDEDGNVTQTQQPTGTTTKTVKSSILLMKAAVALQEAMARIEKLEAEVAALKGA